MGGYLFAHFTGEHKDGEQVYFSISKDGLYWTDLNGGKPVLKSRIGEGGVRDPFVIRDPRSEQYYLIATDLRIEAGKGWEAAQAEGSLDLIVWESKDLVNWSEPRACRVGLEGAGCVWAPEAIYDEEKEGFFVFFASKIQLAGESKAKHRIYGTYTENFMEFTKPFVYLERHKDVIDTTIIQKEGIYYRFSKDETSSRILLERGESILGAFTPIGSPILDGLEGVEGPECYLLPDNQTWCLILDRFREGKGYMPLLCTHPESGEFRMLKDSQYDFGKNRKRHGGVLQLTDEEYSKYGKALGRRSRLLMVFMQTLTWYTLMGPTTFIRRPMGLRNGQAQHFRCFLQGMGDISRIKG